jgi:hypothetical protein
VSTKLSSYIEYEQAGKSAGRVALSIEAEGSDGAARSVTLEQNAPLTPPPPVQFVLCFENDARDDPALDGRRGFYVGFREKNGVTILHPASAHEVATGLQRLRIAFLQTARMQLKNTGR